MRSSVSLISLGHFIFYFEDELISYLLKGLITCSHLNLAGRRAQAVSYFTVLGSRWVSPSIHVPSVLVGDQCILVH